MANIRKTAVLILNEVLEQKQFFADMREKHENEIKGAEKFVSMLVLTALRKKCFSESVLQKFLQKPLKKKDIFAHYALLCALTEIFYLDTPPYAVLNEYVDAVKHQNGKFIAALVNAILRKISSEINELKKEDNKEDLPNEFKKMLIADYGKEVTNFIEQCYAAKPFLDVTMPKESEVFMQRTGAKRLDETSYRISQNTEIGKLYGYEEGLWWVQDYAASLPVKMFSNLKGKKVLDLCAAPGGKTAQLLYAGAKVTAIDISPSRVERLMENLRRLKLPETEVICADALSYLQNYKGELFDAVLVDAPCSATGTLRRHPEIPHIKTKEDVVKMANIQKKFLQEASKVLKKSGELVYCVCSVFKAEGEDIIYDFLQKNKNFQLKNPIILSLSDKRIKTKEGYFRTLPFYGDGMDAFFAAKLLKI